MSLQLEHPRVETTKLGMRFGTKRPDRIDEERRCHCGTKLSSYNQNDETCFRHSPIRFPRTRGTPG